MRWQDLLTGYHGLWWMSSSGSTRFPSEEAVGLPQLAQCKDLEHASISICVHRRPPLSLPRSKPPRLKPPRAPPFFKRLSVSRSISASSLTFFGNWPPSPTASFPPLHLPFTLLASTWIAEREGYNSWHADHRYCILYQKGRFLQWLRKKMAIKNRGQPLIEAFGTESSDGQRCCLVRDTSSLHRYMTSFLERAGLRILTATISNRIHPADPAKHDLEGVL